METALLRRLEEQIDGEILESSFSVGRAEGLLLVTLRAHCLRKHCTDGGAFRRRERKTT